MSPKKKTYEEHIAAFEAAYPDHDLYMYAGPIGRPFDDEVIGEFEQRQAKRKHLIFFLTTYGGDPDAAYRIARRLQGTYGRLPDQDKKDAGNIGIFVDTVCASAGTLIAFGGSHLIMSDYAELSPLDIQIRKPDDAWERDSGLTPTQALDLLERRSKSLFKEHFNQLRLDSELGLTTKTAVEVASTITTGLLAAIYGQLDPMRLGEVERLMGITAAYGERLGKHKLTPAKRARPIRTPRCATSKGAGGSWMRFGASSTRRKRTSVEPRPRQRKRATFGLGLRSTPIPSWSPHGASAIEAPKLQSHSSTIFVPA